ncbi:hypothetical protein MSG28_004003 [Choristoneura fumiferana]|uniref:Uncharacterized protein n=1 Tax=Choristoneura fumiferana TaxID=7141 RepID=A0ACC0KHK0_CHOFU|nr:hypothetical protein MSG28_004003 [Choristoneura fumiferana]
MANHVFTRDLSVGQSRLMKLKTDDGRIVSSKPELLEEVERFYGQLYMTTRTPVENLAKDPRARLTRNYTEDMYEISMALKQLKNGKAPGDDGITAKLLKAGGNHLVEGSKRKSELATSTPVLKADFYMAELSSGFHNSNEDWIAKWLENLTTKLEAPGSIPGRGRRSLLDIAFKHDIVVVVHTPASSDERRVVRVKVAAHATVSPRVLPNGCL